MYTLVRHNLWATSYFPQFRNGLEPLRVGEVGSRLVQCYGGVLLPSLDSAWDAAEGFTFRSGTSQVPVEPDGQFREVPYLRRQLFVPEFSGDLIAA